MKTRLSSILSIFLLSLGIFLIGCESKSEKRDNLSALLLQQLANGIGNDNQRSLVELESIDFSLSYTGKCMDQFAINGGGVSSTLYFRTPAGGSGGIYNTSNKKTATSRSTCAELGFTPGTNFGSSTQRPNPDDGFTFATYYCDPINNPCNTRAITAAGF